MRSISERVPLTQVVRSVQEPRLDLGSPSGNLAVLAGLVALTTACRVTLRARAEA